MCKYLSTAGVTLFLTQTPCKENTANLSVDDVKALGKMLNDRTFGGYYSIYQRHAFNKNGPGMQEKRRAKPLAADYIIMTPPWPSAQGWLSQH
jgi:hypothetical protein